MPNAFRFEILKQLISEEKAREIDTEEEEYLQPLINLGYLDRLALDSTQELDHVLVEGALRVFVADAGNAGFPAQLEFVDQVWVPNHATLEWMQDLISIEGEFPIAQLPALGEHSLWSRILHYRLWVFGFAHVDFPMQPWSEASNVGLLSFADLFSFQLPRALERLGDIHTIIDSLLDAPHFFMHHARMAVFQFDAASAAPWKSKNKRPFLRALEDTVPENEYAKLADLIENPHEAQLAKLFDSNPNKFILRLVRVFQWVNGYYHGDLGPTFSEKSFESLLDLVDLDRKRDFKGLAVDLVNGYWGLNIVFLLRRMDLPDEKLKVATVPKGLADLGAALEEKKDTLLDIFETKSTPLMSISMSTERSQRRKELIQLGYFEYRGTKAMLETAFRYSKNFWDWLKEKWEQLKGLVKNIAGFVFRMLREAYRCLADGLSILLGKRVVNTSNVVLTDFAFDFDAYTAVASHSTPAQLEQHGKIILAKAQGMHGTLVVLGKVIRFVYDTTNPVGWIQLGMKIAEFIKELVAGKFGRRVAGEGIG